MKPLHLVKFDLNKEAASASTSENLLLERARNLLRGNKRSATDAADELEDSASSWFPSDIIDKIMETLKTHLPVSRQEGLRQLMNMAVSFEKKIYAAATNESDYLRMISSKMMAIEPAIYRNPIAYSLQLSAPYPSIDPSGQEGRRRIKKMQFMEFSINEELMKPSSDRDQAETFSMMGFSSCASNKMDCLLGANGSTTMEIGDWRIQLGIDYRQRIVTKIFETVKRHLDFGGQEGLQEAKKIAVRFEEKIYTVATSQLDYLRKISVKALTMETKSHYPGDNSSQSRAANTWENPTDLEGHRTKKRRFTELSEEVIKPSDADNHKFDGGHTSTSPLVFKFL